MLCRFPFSTCDERKVFDHQFFEVLVFFLTSCRWFLAREERLQIGHELAVGALQAGRIEAWVDPVPRQVRERRGDHAIVLGFFGVQQVDQEFGGCRVTLASRVIGRRLSVDASGHHGCHDAG